MSLCFSASILFLHLSPQLGIVLLSLLWHAQDFVGLVTRLKDLFRIRIFANVGVPFPGKFFPSALYLVRSRSRFNTKSRVIVFNPRLALILPRSSLSFTTSFAPVLLLSASPPFPLLSIPFLLIAAKLLLLLSTSLTFPLPFPLLSRSILPLAANILFLFASLSTFPLLPLPTF